MPFAAGKASLASEDLPEIRANIAGIFMDWARAAEPRRLTGCLLGGGEYTSVVRNTRVTTTGTTTTLS